MILFASSGRVNSTMMDEADFVGAVLKSHPMYLMLASGMNGLLSYSNSFLIPLNFSISINPIRILCVIMPYVRI